MKLATYTFASTISAMTGSFDSFSPIDIHATDGIDDVPVPKINLPHTAVYSIIPLITTVISKGSNGLERKFMIDWREVCSNWIKKIATPSKKSVYHADVPWSSEICRTRIFLSTIWSMRHKVTSKREGYNNNVSINFFVIAGHHVDVFIWAS